MKIILTFILILATQISVVAQQSSLKTYFDREAEYEHFSGSVLVVQNQDTVLKESYGFADFQTGRKNTFDTPIDIGSVSKQFTAAAILHLVEEGKVKLNEPANNYLGDYKNESWEDVTIHHLLTHSSGVPSLFQSDQGIEFIMPTTEAVTLSELIGYFKEVELLFDPGDEYRYSNSGYILLAAIIENVSGQSYKEYMEAMFVSYGLQQTTFGPPNGFYAMPQYNYRHDLMKAAPLNHLMWAIGAGGIYSTPKDLAKWIQAIQSEDFLSAELRDDYLKPHQERQNGHYAYGWEITKDENRIIQHDGANFGYISYLGFRPETNETVVILTNQTYEELSFIGGSANYVAEIWDKIWSVLDGGDINPLPGIVEASLETGTYEFEEGQQFQITKVDSKYEITGIDGFIPTRLIFEYPIPGSDTRSENLLTAAKHMKKGKFWGMASACNFQMKFAIYSGLFSWGFGKVTEDLGDIATATPFQVDENSGLIRLTAKESILDVIVYFNDEGDIQGIFEEKWSKPTERVNFTAFPTGESTLFLDGFPYNETSAMITYTEKGLIYTQGGRTFVAKKVD